MSKTNEKDKDKLSLRVADARSKDVGRGIARLDPDLAAAYQIKSGDVIQLENPLMGKKTACLVWPGFRDDAGKAVIRIDGSTRRNLNASLDERVYVRKITVKPAESVTFAWVDRAMRLKNTQYFAQVLENRVVSPGDLLRFHIMNYDLDFAIVGFRPRGEAVQINRDTEIIIEDKVIRPEDLQMDKRVMYDDIGGLTEEIQKVREMIELPLRHPELFNRLGIEPPKGVLLYGPPGTGKTLLAKAVAHETNAHFINLSGPEIMSKFYGQSEENLRNVFKEAQEKAPSIIFIDELDSIAPKRGETQGDVERRVVAQLLALMDGLDPRGNVVVIGATNRQNALDPALRRPGRFDREIEIGVPDKKGRLEILQIHTRGMPLADDVDLNYYAQKTHGFVGADLQMIGKEAAMKTLRRILPDLKLEEDEIPLELLESLSVTKADFDGALTEVEPSALREVFIQTPPETWDDVGGLEEAKQLLREIIEWPLKYPNIYKHMGARPPKGILLWGLPGTGKTLLAKALAHESEVNFISVKGPEFLSKWVGESEKAVRETFRKARSAAPCIIFLDEIDAIAPVRGGRADSQVTERVISQLLTEMDGLEALNNVVIIAATNRPDIIDPALLRAGRFGRHIEVPLPDLDTREKIFEIHMKERPVAKGISYRELAKRMEGKTGADIEALCQEATILAIREGIMIKNFADSDKNVSELVIEMKHFEEAMKSVEKEAQRTNKTYQKLEGALPNPMFS
ncbi:MAG: CDC48 family AAA ATPase [Candidatus Lokiarchaeota archaeon]|nr:CDC48 family AAA ATPase [Candidatus Lokiarchaeota archaeon]